MKTVSTTMRKCRFCGARAIPPGLMGGHCCYCGSYGTYDSPAARYVRELARQISDSCWQDALAYAVEGS